RRGARPVPGRRLPLALPGARLAARTAPQGAREIVDAVRSGSPAELAACKRTLLVSFRRDGRAVPTPVWAAEAGGIFYVRTERSAGKVKRLRRDPRLLLAPCTVRGVPLGAPLEAHARLLDVDREGLAERTVAGRRPPGGPGGPAGRRGGGAPGGAAREPLRRGARAVRARDGPAARGHGLSGDRAWTLGSGELNPARRARRAGSGADGGGGQVWGGALAGPHERPQ